jgi:hypothetical protein
MGEGRGERRPLRRVHAGVLSDKSAPSDLSELAFAVCTRMPFLGILRACTHSVATFYLFTFSL